MSKESVADIFSISELSLWDDGGSQETPPVSTEEPTVEETSVEDDSEPQEVEEEIEVEEAAPDVTVYGSLLDTLAQDELIDFEDDVEYDVDNIETVKTILKKTKEKAKLKGQEEFLKSLPDSAKQLVEILQKGGSIDDFVNIGQQVVFAQVPIENEDGEDISINQELLVRDYLLSQGFKEDTITRHIEKYAETGLLKDQALMAREFLATKQEKDNKQLIQDRELKLKADQENEERLATQFKETVMNTKEIKGFKVTNNQGFYDFITKPGSDGKTAFQKVDTEENKLLYAYMAYTGFDKAKLEKQVSSTQIRKLKRTLESNDTNVTRRGSSVGNKSVAELKDIVNFTI